jgi:hypothetical protein
MKRSGVGMATLMAALVATLPPPARAAVPTYSVQVCGASGNYDAFAFGDLSRSTGFSIGRTCFPYGRGLRGLVTISPRARRRAGQNTQAAVRLRAPWGTALSRITWVGRASRADCTWTAELYADAPRQRKIWVTRLPAYSACGSRAQASDAPYPKRVGLGNRTSLIQRVICRGRTGCSRSSASFVQTRTATITLADIVPPQVRITGGGLAGGRWLRGYQGVSFMAADNVGVASERLFVDGAVVSAHGRMCNAARVIQCPSGPGSLSFDTSRFGDGIHGFAVEARDAAGLPARAPGFARLDNTPPGRIDAALAGGQAWRRVNAFLITWTNPTERFAPISAASWRMCTGGGSSCRSGRRQAASISSLPMAVPGPGDWTLQVWREDAAGNSNPGYASVPVHLRYDPVPPLPVFEPESFADPTRVSVAVLDAHSGLAGGEIEMRRQGTSTWTALPTRREVARLTTRIDDSKFAAGIYELRSRAVDAAGNEATTQRRSDGSPMILTLPLRFDAVMRTGFVRSRTVRKVIRRHGRRRAVHRHVRRLVPVIRARVGRRLRIRGSIRNPDGQPIGGAPIYVYSTTGVLPSTLAGFVVSDPAGKFSYIARASSNRQLSFVYPGAALIRPTQNVLRLSVPASSSISANRRRVRNGRSVLFRGGIRTRPVPAIGKLVEMQAFFRGRWRTFSTLRTDRRGRWRFRYRFGATRGTVRYRFRVVMPSEGGYPFGTGRSRVVKVTVHG